MCRFFPYMLCFVKMDVFEGEPDLESLKLSNVRNQLKELWVLKHAHAVSYVFIALTFVLLYSYSECQ